jgi:AraC-like DNA-binding protein
VGRFGHWLAVRPAGAAEDATRVLGEAGLRVEGRAVAAGWLRAASGREAIGWSELDRLAGGLAERLAGPVLAGWVYDSDHGYLAAAEPAGVRARLVIGQRAARSSGATWPRGWRSQALRTLPEWSRAYAPRPIRAEDLARILRVRWTLAEEGVEAIFVEMGLDLRYSGEEGWAPAPGGPVLSPATSASIGAGGLVGYERPLPWMRESIASGGRRIPWRDLRYVLGLGPDQVGIWDRQAPDAPIERFPRTRRGAHLARERWDRLIGPTLARARGAGNLAGLERLPATEAVVVAGHVIELRSAPYVVGHGRDFAGVWDRERPEDGPIERFPHDDRGLFRAQQSAAGHLRSWLLRTKALSSGRWMAFGASPYGLEPVRVRWLMAEEESDPRWAPHQVGPRQGHALYLVTEEGGQPAVHLDRIAGSGADADRVDRGLDAVARGPARGPPQPGGNRTLGPHPARVADTGRVTASDLVRLRRARDRMDRDYAEPLDVPALASAALMSPGHFSRSFRAAFGETPYSYLMTRRIERAKALLRRGDLTVTEVCFAVGCTSLGSFSSRFTELVGESPSSYRARRHDQGAAIPACFAKIMTRPIRNGEANPTARPVP